MLPAWQASRAAAYLAVANGGPAIEPGLAALLFEPFRRLCDPVADPAGAGFGLSIVCSVAVAHHGDVIARARPAGGLDMSILLPGNGSDMTKNSHV